MYRSLSLCICREEHQACVLRWMMVGQHVKVSFFLLLTNCRQGFIDFSRFSQGEQRSLASLTSTTQRKQALHLLLFLALQAFYLLMCPASLLHKGMASCCRVIYLQLSAKLDQQIADCCRMRKVHVKKRTF